MLQRLALLLWTLLTAAIFAASARAAEPLAEIPYRMDYQGWITVSTTINDQGPYDFIVDTGATITSVFQNLADNHEFSLADRDPIRILGLIAAQSLPAYKIGAVEVTGSERPMNDHVGVILPDWQDGRKTPHGVLGLDFLTQYTVLFDADRQVMQIYGVSQPVDDLPKGWRSINMTADDFSYADNPGAGTLYRINVDLHGRKVPCIIDLGASGTIVNYPALRRLLSGVYMDRQGSAGFSTGSRINDIFDNTKEVRSVQIRRIKIARAQWNNRVLLVYNAPIFNELRVSHRPYCLVGSDLMTEYSFMFDFARERLYMGPKAKRRRAKTG